MVSLAFVGCANEGQGEVGQLAGLQAGQLRGRDIDSTRRAVSGEDEVVHGPCRSVHQRDPGLTDEPAQSRQHGAVNRETGLLRCVHCCELHRCASLGRADADIRAAVDQGFGHDALSGGMKGCPAPIVEQVDLCAGRDEHGDHLVIAGYVQWGHSVRVACIGTSPAAGEEARHLGVALHGCPVERRHVKTRAGVWVSASVKQNGRNVCLPVRCCEVQRCPVRGIFSVDLRASCQERAHGINMPSSRSLRQVWRCDYRAVRRGRAAWGRCM